MPLHDEAAFRAAFRDLHPRLLRYLAAIVGKDAEDTAAMVWLQVVRDLDKFDGDYADFRGWVTIIARNRAVDVLRLRNKAPLADVRADELTELISPEDTETTVLARVATQRILKMITALPPDQAEAILLRVVLGLTGREAARVLGKKPGAVRAATQRGLNALARRLESRAPASGADRS
jgi:RNA polymerase sigma-70 factor (ECF subfamily)